jgi:hypothetical protein
MDAGLRGAQLKKTRQIFFSKKLSETRCIPVKASATRCIPVQRVLAKTKTQKNRVYMNHAGASNARKKNEKAK